MPHKYQRAQWGQQGFSVVDLCRYSRAASSGHVEVRGQLGGADSLLPSHGACSYQESKCFWRRSWRRLWVKRDPKVSLNDDSSNFAGFLAENSKECSHFMISFILKTMVGSDQENNAQLVATWPMWQWVTVAECAMWVSGLFWFCWSVRNLLSF